MSVRSKNLKREEKRRLLRYFLCKRKPRMGLKQYGRKMKPLLPTLRQKKRYIAFEIVSETHLADKRLVFDEILRSQLEFLGSHSLSTAAPAILEDRYDGATQRGLLRVNHTALPKAKAALTLMRRIGNQRVIVRSRGVSGIIKKAHNKYIGS